MYLFEVIARVSNEIDQREKLVRKNEKKKNENAKKQKHFFG